jgi:hypothetical protein
VDLSRYDSLGSSCRRGAARAPSLGIDVLRPSSYSREIIEVIRRSHSSTTCSVELGTYPWLVGSKYFNLLDVHIDNKSMKTSRPLSINKVRAVGDFGIMAGC